MKTEEFKFNLPEEFIAQKSSEKRSGSKLMVYKKEADNIEHRKFKNIIDYFKSGDVLVLNNSKVIPARIFVEKETGAKIELLLLNEIGNNRWEALAKPRKRLNTDIDLVKEDIKIQVEKLTEWGGVVVKFPKNVNIYDFLDKKGNMPIPPYINNTDENYLRNRYQTVYAEKEGSVAAPTSGLHFTKDLINKLKKKGVTIAYITLHVGLGTFRPVNVEDVEDFDIHSEYYEINKNAVDKINNCNGKIVACGTTVTRTLEYMMKEKGNIEVSRGWCDLFIYPGYKFEIVNNLITNFHLPKSSLIMLVGALVGKNKILSLYKKAIKREYRFYSFGDAMFILGD